MERRTSLRASYSEVVHNVSSSTSTPAAFNAGATVRIACRGVVCVLSKLATNSRSSISHLRFSFDVAKTGVSAETDASEKTAEDGLVCRL